LLYHFNKISHPSQKRTSAQKTA